MKAALIYLRQSFENSQAKATTDALQQEEGCRSYCSSLGWFVRAVFCDVDPGSNVRRSALRDMVDYCVDHPRSVVAVVVHSWKSLTRSTQDFFCLARLFGTAGVPIHSVTQGVLDQSGIDRLRAAAWCSAATADGMRDVLLQGRWPFRPPLGYELREGRLVPDGTAPIIRAAFDRCSTGDYSIVEVYRWSVDQGLRTRRGTRPSLQSFSYMMRNRLYAGQIRAMGVEIVGNFDALVPESVFESVQQILSHDYRAA